MNSPKYNILNAAYLYYYASDVAFEDRADQSGALRERLKQLIADALIIADQSHFDVFNALTLMDNVDFLTDLRVCLVFASAHFLRSRLFYPVRRWGWLAELLSVQLAHLTTRRREAYWKRACRSGYWRGHAMIPPHTHRKCDIYFTAQ